MKGDAIRAKVLSVKIISNINDEMAKEIGGLARVIEV